MILQGKFLYREDCELKQTWDAPLQKNLVSKWERWESALPTDVNSTHSEMRACVELPLQCTLWCAKHPKRHKGW